ncbi:MAG: hypothetical protein WCO20_09090 [Holophagaceae bacterium]|nr:hypothetical protein [Acidobacteriota bacterium]
MRKIPLLLTLTTLCVASLAVAQAELRPIQKVMQARAAWMKAMNQNLAAKDLTAVAKDAGELSAQAAKIAGGAEGERRVLHQQVADLAKGVAEAATKGDEVLTKAKLGEIKATCADCHAKFRDK